MSQTQHIRTEYVALSKQLDQAEYEAQQATRDVAAFDRYLAEKQEKRSQETK